MRVKVEMNSKGEVKAHRIEIPIQGGGGDCFPLPLSPL